MKLGLGSEGTEVATPLGSLSGSSDDCEGNGEVSKHVIADFLNFSIIQLRLIDL